jgi:heme-degrading monooxygenase HmoA
MYAWEYRVAEEQLAAFLDAYGERGEWVRLFQGAPGYRRTELHRDRRDPRRFLTLDYWESETAWRRFREEQAREFEALDARCELLTFDEREIGSFEAGEPGR